MARVEPARARGRAAHGRAVMTRTPTHRCAGSLDTPTDWIERTTNVRIACLSFVALVLLAIKVCA